MKSRRSKRIAVIVGLMLMQCTLFGLACVSDSFSEYGNYIRDCISKGFLGILVLSGMSLSIVAAVLTLKVYWDLEKQVLTELESAELHKNREMIRSLRAQRHEFGNHLQVVGGLIQLNKCSRALEYISDVVGDIRACRSHTVINESPIVNALLLSKFTQAQNSGIGFSVDLEADLDKIEAPQYKVAKVLANIINNALDAVSSLQKDERRVKIKVFQTPKHIAFQVWNGGSFINPSHMEEIFKPGYTTKGGEGQGLGLYIVEGLLEEMNGEIQVTSAPDAGTMFTVFFPLLAEAIETLPKQTSAKVSSIEGLGGCD
jgi:sensor histidine kinase regulating citrate/malate metabolism